MRIFSTGLVLLIGGCSTDPSSKDATVGADAGTRVECALGGVKDFAADCSIERGESASVTLRHRSGTFRKVILEDDGTVDTADGAETVSVEMLNDGRAEISIGEDRYRLPATL